MIWDILSRKIVDNFASISNVHWVDTILKSLLFSAMKPNGINVLSVEFIEDSMAFFLGDSSGNLLVSKVSSLASAYQKRLRSTHTQGADIKSASRQFFAHTSSVLYTCQHNQRFFSSAYKECCIFQWELNYEDPTWELDYAEIVIGADPFAEVPQVELFNKIFSETWMPQSELSVKFEKNIELRLEACIGRRARDRRNNLKYDSEDRIVYIAGNNLIAYSKDTASQTFLQYKNKTFRANLGEISCFCLTPDKRMAFLGTSELECKISLWDLNAYVMVLSIPLQDYCTVLSMHLSPSCRYLSCIVLSKLYQQSLLLLEISTDFSVNLIASTAISSTCPYKIKDVCVLENNSIEILTCGMQHFMRWKLQSKQLHYYSIALPESMTICLLCIFVYQNVIVTAADDGKIYIWHEDKIIKSVPGHDGCVLSLEINEELGIAVTGGIDGHVIVWKISVSGDGVEVKAHLESLREYSLQDPNAYNHAYAVQSLCVGNFLQDKGFQVLIGTQNGDIYELSYEINADLDALVKVSASVDTQNIKSMGCDVTSSFFFTLSASGMFGMWDLRSFAQVYSNDFKKNGVKLSVFHKKHFETEELGKFLFVLVGFEDEIILIKISDSTLIDHEVLEEFTIEATHISDIRISANEKYLAVACNNEQKPQVDIYLIHSDSFALDKNLFGFRAPVIRLDFSTDGYYLMCEDNLGEVLLFELETQNIANFNSVEFEIEWLNEGLRHSSGLKAIHQLYNINNKIACITKSPALSTLAIGDEFGVIALYQLPYVPGSLLIMIPAHAYHVNLIMFSVNDEHLITFSELDRTILKWDIVGGNK